MWTLFNLLRAMLSALANNTAAVRDNTEQLREVSYQLDELLKRLFALPDPGPIFLSVTSEDQNMLTFTIHLPAEPAEPNDIVSGELTVTVANSAPVVFPTDKGQAEVSGLTGNQGDTVTATFTYIDDASPPNRSVHASVLNVVLNDTIPPPSPGNLSLEVTAES